MRIALIAAFLPMAVVTAGARQSEASPLPKVRIYVANDAVPPEVLHLAEVMAAGMFATTAVRIEWHGHPPANGSLRVGVISISLGTNTPARLLPGALAFSRVYEGVILAC